jgi:hypothetical protein
VATKHFNDAVPAAPPGAVNVIWQQDAEWNISAHVPAAAPMLVSGPHAARPPAASEGALYWESDRRVFYLYSAGAWNYAGGVAVGAAAAKPADLAAADVGFLYFASDAAQLLIWTGAAWSGTTALWA